MEFNPSSGSQGLINDITFWTGATTTEYSLADRTRNLNTWYHKVITMILNAIDEWDFDDPNHSNKHPIITRALVANRRDYVFSTALWSLIATEGGSAGSNAAIKPLKIKRVDICWDGTGNVCYKAEPVDTSEMGLGLGNDTEIDGRFSKTEPKYDLDGNAINIYPRASSANVDNSGVLRVEFVREIDEFTTSDTTQEPGFDEPFHRMLSIGTSLDYAIKHGLPNKNDLMALLVDYEERLKKYYGSKSADRNYMLKSAFVDYR